MDLFNNDWPSPPKLEEPSNIQMDLVTELQDGTFEPQQRARSNTWPLPRPENFVEPPDESDSKQASNQQLATDSSQAGGQVATSKKNSSRRNAWGNLSYADLITHAIGSATDKRLTLSQIYEWMVQNVPYFKDKGDSNSSAGWKNSIRHNLSLHNRFMRVQNEGTGKSSWWMLNPDAKPGKSVRRRAASMETSKYEKRRGRAKKRVEALRNESAPGLNDATPSPSSSVSEGLDLFPESPLHSSSQGFPLSPDFRQRASSNASSCGRLSPIPALVEPEWNFANPTPSATDFNQNSTSVTSAAQAQALDQLAGSLADDLTLQNKFLQGFSAATVIHNQPPPPYQPPQPWNATVAPTYGIQQTQCPIHRSLPCTCLHNSREGLSPSSGTDMSPAYPHSEPSPDPLGSYNTIVLGGQRITPRPPSNSPPLTPTPQKMNSLEQADEFIDFELSQSLPGIKWSSFELPTRIGILEDDNDLKFIDNFEDLENIRLIESVKVYNCLWDTTSADYTNRRAVDKAWEDVAQHNPQIAPSTLMGQFMEALNNQTQLDELNIDSFHGGLECNVEELIQQELSIDGLLDINIPITTTNPITTTHNNTQQTVPTIGGLGLSQSQPTNTHTKVQYSQTSVTPPSWVH